MFLTSAARSGGEVRNTEAARCELVCAGSRGDQAGTAARSALTRGCRAVRSVCGVRHRIVQGDRGAGCSGIEESARLAKAITLPDPAAFDRGGACGATGPGQRPGTA
jgi:hypothetical protein